MSSYITESLSERTLGQCFIYEEEYYILLEKNESDSLCQHISGRKIELYNITDVAPVSGQDFLRKEAEADKEKEMPVVIIEEDFMFRVKIGKTEKKVIVRPLDLVFRTKNSSMCTIPCRVVERL